MRNISLLLSLLLIGSASVTVSAVSFSAIAAAAGSVVTAIAGVVYPLFSSGRPLVTCDIEIENWTKWTLYDQLVYARGGSVLNPGGLVIPPAQKTTLMAEKTHITATGTYGVASWRVGNLNRRIWFMWSVAYDRNFHPLNWLAVGISHADVTSGPSVWRRMYYGPRNFRGRKMVHARRGYGQVTSGRVITSDNVLIVRGTLGSSRTASGSIIVQPYNDDNLANPIRARLNGRG